MEISLDSALEIAVPHQIQREKLALSRSRRRSKELDLKLPPGEWIVWWYSKIVRNLADNTVPLVKVVFRALDGNNLTGEIEIRDIALSRLRLYQMGVILQDGYPVAKVGMTTEYFDVDFSNGWKWNRVSRHQLCAPSSPYLLPKDCDDDWLLRFTLPDRKSLIVNCIDFLVSGYSLGSELPRILTTYEWPEVMSRLLAQSTPLEERNLPDQLVVYPHRDMLQKDRAILALLANGDGCATRAAKHLFSQVSPKSFKSGQPHSLQVRPWFLGATTLKCRGFWTQGKTHFICTALVGTREPPGLKIDIRRVANARDENAPGDLATPLEKGRRLAESDLDIVMTDSHQPISDYIHEDIEAEEFEFITTRESTRTKVEKPFGQVRFVPKDMDLPEKYGTGDSQGQGDAATGKMTTSAITIDIEAQGALIEMWKAFSRMALGGKIKGLSWYVSDHAHTEGPPKCIAFSDRLELGPSWEHRDPQARAEEFERQNKWITIKEDVRRGMMYLLVTEGTDLYLVAEIQRHRWIGKDSKPKEQSFCGLICHIHDHDTARIKQICGHIDQALPEHNGVFKNMSWPFDYQCYIFPHHWGSDPNALLDKAAANALNGIIDLKHRRLRTSSST